MQSNKQLFVICCGAMLLANMAQIYFDGAKAFAYIFFRGLGASLFSVPLWILLGGYVILQLMLGLINLAKPDSKIKLDHWRTAAYGLLIGVVLKLVFNIKV